MSLLFVGGLMTSGNAMAELPMPLQPGCGVDGDVSNCPSELRESDGSVKGGMWHTFNFIPEAFTKVRPEETATGSSSTTAWHSTTGRFDVPIAVLDCGIRWNRDGIINKVWLNTGELPLPQRADGSTCAEGDCDGNGLWTVSDYAADARVSITAGVADADDKLETSDLIAVFSDGIDGDGNGYIDDIGGWDFMWDDNNAYTDNDFYHGTSVMEEAAAEGNNGGDIGHCPNCAVLPIRISDSFVGEGNKIAAGIIYAVDRGVKVIGMALGSLSNSPLLIEAMQYAWDNDVTIVAAAGDELGYHHNVPGANDYAIYVHSIKNWPPFERENAQTFQGFLGCNNFGSRLDIVAASDGCATGSVAAISGMAGLVYSRAADLGVVLTSPEARQILIQGVDDVYIPSSQRPKSPYFPSDVGWDLFFGYGRANSAKAIGMVTPRTIPPEVELVEPAWFDYIDPRVTPMLEVTGRLAANRTDSYRYELSWGPGAEPRESEFQRFAQGTALTAPLDGVLGTLDLSAIPLESFDAAADVVKTGFEDTLQEKVDKVHAHALTLRINVTDIDGNVAEMRRQIFLREDPDMLPGFPIDLGGSGDSSPVLYDMDGDGSLEVIMGTSGGSVYVFKGDGSIMDGWPVRLDGLPAVANHPDAYAYSEGLVEMDPRQGIIGAVAVGDLDDNGMPEVVVASLDGFLYAFNTDGSSRAGFPVFRDPIDSSLNSPDVWMDPGMIASPVLYDLDRDGQLEIIQSAMDRKVYIWREDGTRQPGWPVVLQSADYENSNWGRIVSSPAIGDLDGDGEMEIIVGTNEYLNDKTWWGLAYALHAEGSLTTGGPIVSGWPVEVLGAMNGLIMYIGEGVASSPGVLDVDGDGRDEVVLSGVAGSPMIYRGNGRVFRHLDRNQTTNGNQSNADTGFWSIVSNPAIGDIDGDGKVDVSMVGSGLDYLLALGLSTKLDYAHLLGAWDASSGRYLEAFPAFLEDISFFLAPSIADISGDGLPEVIAGTSGFILHAVDKNGDEPVGWPKQTGGWMIASPTVGDINGDGLHDVVAVTREGFLFAWTTNGDASIEPEWGGIRHDPQNTGNYGHIGDRGQ